MTNPRDILLGATTPTFWVGGSERIALARDAVDVLVEETGAGMKRLALTLDAIGPQRGARDEQLLYMDGDILDFGAEIKVAMGRASQQLTIFTGKISAISLLMEQGNGPKVQVFAEDKLMELRMARRFKTYENVSDADLVQQIASQHGLRASADAAGPTMKMVQQWNQSDLAFLRDRARRLAADVWIDDGTLHMATRDRRTANRLTLIQGNDLVAIDVRADLAHQRSKVKVGGFDAAGKDAIDEAADAGAIRAEAGSGRSGIDILAPALGERTSHHVRDVPLKDDQARAWGKAALLRRARRFVTAHGITIGTPAMTVGSVLKLERIGKLFEGDGYYVTRVSHTFDTVVGYRTAFEAERPWLGRGT